MSRAALRACVLLVLSTGAVLPIGASAADGDPDDSVAATSPPLLPPRVVDADGRLIGQWIGLGGVGGIYLRVGGRVTTIPIQQGVGAHWSFSLGDDVSFMGQHCTGNVIIGYRNIYGPGFPSATLKELDKILFWVADSLDASNGLHAESHWVSGHCVDQPLDNLFGYVSSGPPIDLAALFKEPLRVR